MAADGDLCTFSLSLFELVPIDSADPEESSESPSCTDDSVGQQASVLRRIVFHEQKTRGIIGSGELLPAVEARLLGRRAGEKIEEFSLEWSKEQPCPLLPKARGSFLIELQILDIEPSGHPTAGGHLSRAGSRREAGNREFSSKKFAEAIEQYEEGLRMLNDCPLSVIFTEQQQLESSTLQTTLRLNAAQCCLELGQPRRALEILAPVLTEQPMNAKANYRAGRAELMLKSFEAARRHLTLAQQATPNDTGIAAMLSRLQREEGQAQQKERTAFAKMFD